MPAPFALASLLAGAATGTVVDVPPGHYAADEFPVVVPAGVTFRGPGAAQVVIDAGGATAVVLGGDGAALQGVTVAGAAPAERAGAPGVIGSGHDGLVVRDCALESVEIDGGRGHVIAGNVITGGRVAVTGATHVEIRANYHHGLVEGAGIDVSGGEGHVVAGNECRDDHCAIRCAGTTGARIERNRSDECRVGIELVAAHSSSLYRNRALRTECAVLVDGGSANRVEKQLAEHCDRGVVIEGGAHGTEVADSWLHDSRIGVVVAGAGRVVLRANAISGSREHTIVSDGGDVVADGNDLGGDTWAGRT